MEKFLMLGMFVYVIVLCACTPGLQVSSDYDKSVDFSKYKTFELYSGSANSISSLNHDRIISSVRAEMQAKGFTEDAKEPDLLVNTTAILTTNTEVTANTNVYGYGGTMRPYYWNAGMASSYTTYDVTHYKEGSLIIDVLDASTKKLIWQSTGNNRIDQSTDHADKRIAKAVKMIMEGFPPGKPGH